MEFISKSKLLHPVTVALWLTFVCFSLNYSALSGNWRWDDSSILLHLNNYSIIDTFLNPEIWRELSRTNLMPWLAFSYEVDLYIFGLNPGLFYLHHLLVLAASGLALYFLQTLWISRKFAVYGATLFLVSEPSVIVAQQLMTRHYIEGLLFCLLSLQFFIHYLRGADRLLLVLSVFFYVLSVMSKELYVPLVILLPFLPEATVRQRLMAIIPFTLVVLIYIFWRGDMLGTLTGGYTESDIYLNLSFLPEVLGSFAKFPLLLFGSIWPLFVIPYLLLVSTYLFFTRSKMLVSGLVLLLVLLPLIPLVRSPGILSADRYLFLFWVVISFSVAFFSDNVIGCRPGKTIRAVIVVFVLPLFFLISLFGSQVAAKSIATVASEYDEQAAFIWNNTSDLAFEPSDRLKKSYWFVSNLIEFKERLIPSSSSPLAIPDDVYLDSPVDQLFTYSADCNCMQDISNSIPERRSRFTENVQTDAPLTVEFQYESTMFRWQLGPYQQGTYRIVSNVLGEVMVPPSGKLGITLRGSPVFYISYTSPEGWITYSDELTIVRNAPVVNWHRP
jgi:hypothetical protein